MSAVTTPADTKIFREMVENMPIGVMTCDLEEFRIDYLNRFSREKLREIEHLLPCKADDLLGSCIDIFHRDPSVQRRLLSDPANLPHRAHIQLGDEHLDLNISAIIDDDGNYVAPMVTWSIVTDKVQAERENMQQRQMIDQMPINVMFMEPENCTITFANETSLKTLSGLSHLLPVPVDEIVGNSVDIFHKNPAHQRQILSNPNHFPHSARIQLGDEHLDLRISAVRDREQNYIGAMLTWSVVSDQVRLASSFEEQIQSVVQTVASASSELEYTASSLSSTADETMNRSNSVSVASEELGAAINEISSQVTRSDSIAQEAVSQVHRSSELVDSLAEAAGKIDQVVRLITNIASQTNLLALNATIEASRAGEAGKGFAVVASEVKELAKETSTATGEIAQQIEEIQSATHRTVEAMGSIRKTIEEISDITTNIASAIEEQGAATQEVARNISGVSESSSETKNGSGQVLEAAGELSKQSDALQSQVEGFLEQIKSW